ncbi:MAG: TolC family protein [Tannerella sp.]|jgi:outer membrane protein TolC|nr:TolC family protein [Tannerella sp.]
MKKGIIIFGMLISATCYAQDRVWTLDACMQYAVEHSTQRAKQEARNEAYKADELEAKGAFLPTLGMQSNMSFNFGRGLDPETNTYMSNNVYSNSFDAYSSLVLFNGLANVYRAKLARVNRLLGKAQLQDTKDMIALQTMELFFNVQYYQGTVRLAEQQLAESATTLKQVQRMEELGLKSIPDVAEIQAKEAEDRYMLTKQTNLLELETIKLKEKMNFPIDEALAVAGYRGDAWERLEKENAAEIYQQALIALPKVQAAEKTLSASVMDYKRMKGQLYPTLSMSAGISTGFSRLMDGSEYIPYSNQLKNRRGEYVSLTLSIPVFSGFTRYASVKRSRQQMIIARNEHEETLRQVYSEIEQAVADVNGLSDECRWAQKRTEAMFSAHQVNQRKYEEGLINAIELTTSSNRLLNSRVEELATNLRFQLKNKLLDYYKGESPCKETSQTY